MSPIRIQLRRGKGWRKPEGAIVVARPSTFGNPFTLMAEMEKAAVDPWQARERVVVAYRLWLDGLDFTDYLQGQRGWVLAHIRELRGHDLACWCPLTYPDGSRVPCHADVLLEAANA